MELKAESGSNNRVHGWKRTAVLANTANTFNSIPPSEAPSDFDTTKQILYGNAYQAAWGLFSEYCNNSTIHGIKYLGESKRSLLERLFWMFVFGFSIYACSRLTMNMWEKSVQNPVIVSFAEKSTPVWQIPFPSVTVCPETKSRKLLFNYTDIFWKSVLEVNISSEDRFYMEAISHVCYSGDMYDGSEISDVSELISVFEELEPIFDETYLVCKWQNILGACQDMLSRVLTEEGLCYSFNSLEPDEIYREISNHEDFILNADPVSEQDIPEELNSNTTEASDSSTTENIQYSKQAIWDLENGYYTNELNGEIPHRVFGAGSRGGLFLVLNSYKDDNDEICRSTDKGFKIIMHTPGEIARVSKEYFRISFNKEVLVSIKPKITTTSDALKYYDSSIRQCYFQNERYLAYFKLYTQSNCKLECLANYTLGECGCVKFSMPRDAETPVCGSANIYCVYAAEENLRKKQFKEGLKDSRLNFRSETKCNCLPACTSIAYEAEISQADYDYRSLFQVFNSLGYGNKHPEMQISRVSIFFKETQFLTLKRSELYGITDLIANCGQLLGLFMGVSALSLVELVYYCTVRLITNLKMRHNKMGQLKKHMNGAVTGTVLGIAPEIIITDNEVSKEEI